MTHYETIGVQPTATADEIKRAYRDKVVQCHPDKGGDIDEFKAVAHAHEVLKNPETRLLYDSTGEDKRLPIEVEVQNVLMQVFNAALAQDDDIEIVAFVRAGLTSGAARIPIEVDKLNARKKKLTTKRGKIKAKGVNVVWLIIDAELHAIDGQLANLKHQAEVNKACLKALDKYKEEWEAPPQPQFTTFDLRRQYSPSLNDIFGNRR